MKILMPGGSGQVGTLLGRAFQDAGHEVIELSRKPSSSRPWRVLSWDARKLGPWASEFEGADVIINLAGRNVNCRYNDANRTEILQSRVESTHVVGEAIKRAQCPPRVWLQASTATIYAHRYDEGNDEATGIIGGNEPGVPDTWGFSIDVAKAWEKAVTESGPFPATRTVLLRSAMTMSPDPDGIFDVMLRLVRFGLGGTAGDGRQFISWIHEADFVRAIFWLIEQESVSGPVNLAAPNPLPNEEFMREFRKAWGTKIGLPATRWMLELGAVLLRTETELILKSRRVVPERLLRAGFRFEFPDWPTAARDLCERWRKQKS